MHLESRIDRFRPQPRQRWREQAGPGSGVLWDLGPHLVDQALQLGLARATGRQVQLEHRVDPSIVGGAVARVGSTVYDGSVTTQLEKLKQQLMEAEA